MSDKPPLPWGRFAPSAYMVALKRLTEAARAHGYALGIHGSMATDLDLIAAPWTEEASDGPTLVRALADALGVEEYRFLANPTPGKKPHGRVAHTIVLDGGAYIDVSVMPRAAEGKAPAPAHTCDGGCIDRPCQWRAANTKGDE